MEEKLMYSLLELLPKDMIEKLKNLEVKELSSYVKYLKEVIKERVTTLHHYKNENKKTLASIQSYPFQVGLFWCGKLYNATYSKCSDFVLYSCWNTDIFLLPTVVFTSQTELEKWLDKNSKNYEEEFLYKNGNIFYHENYLPLCDKSHSTISIFYNKLYPLL